MVRPYLLLFSFTVLLLPLAAAELSITRALLTTPHGSSDVKPGELLTINLRLENDGEGDIQDIEISTTFLQGTAPLRDERNDIINLTTTVHVLRKATSVDRTLSFRVPYTVDDADQYTMRITAIGHTANRSTVQAEHQRTTFTIDKLPHELAYQLIGISPNPVECGRAATLAFAVRNIGNDNEDAVFTAVQQALGIEVTDQFSLRKDYDKGNSYSKQFPVSIPTHARGSYTIDTRISYANGREELTQELPLEVLCASPSPSPAVPPAVSIPVPAPEPPVPLSEPPTTGATPPAPDTAEPPGDATRTSPRIKTTLLLSIGTIAVAVLVLLVFVVSRLRRIRQTLR